MMLRPKLGSLTNFPSFSRSFSAPKHYCLPKRIFTTKMSSSTIEHIVLFKAKADTDPSKIGSMLSNLSSLASLDQVLHITAGPILRNRSSAFNFTHLLHSRYRSKEDLAGYSAHPSHVSVVKEHVLPICEDIMAVDWISGDLAGPVAVEAGSAIRVTFLKLKEGLGDAEKKLVLEVIGGVKESFGTIDQISFGENFSPARAKGFSIASVAVFRGLDELDALDSDKEAVKLQKEKARDLLESVIVVDYVVPPQTQPSTL